MRAPSCLTILALLALTACSSASPPPPPETAAAVVTPSPAETPSPAAPADTATPAAAAASPTAEPATAEPTTAAASPTAAGGAATPSAGEGVAVEELGVRFLIPSGVATGATGETVPAAGIGDPQAPAWGVYPEHSRLTLQGYPVAGDALQPAILVFPLADYTAASPLAAEAIEALRGLLTAQAASPESIPVLPLFNAAQLLRAQVEYLPFGGGSGVRFVTFYAQNAAPLANPGLLYVYQGLSDDGRHLVSVTLPVTTPALDPAAPAVPFPTADAAGGFSPEAYQAYLAALGEELNALGPADFTPDLARLDALVQSIQVE